jgi:hypothetical protein
MPVPYTFGTATTSIPLSNLDANFNTPVTIGNTTVGLGNTVTTIGNLTLTNATISTGNVTVTTGIFGAGSNTAPSITTTGDTNTGIFFPAADTIAFTEGGVEAMRIDSSANIGIGTTAPTSTAGFIPRLQLTSAFSTALLITSTSTTQQNLVGTNGSGLFLESVGNATGTSNNIIFRTTSSNSFFGGDERMRIDSSGNVGIGTSSPGNKLEVYGTATDTTIEVNGTGRYRSFEIHASGSRVGYLSDDSTDTIMRLVTNRGTLSFSTGEVERMRITSAGNVGIGTSSPPQLLAVHGASDPAINVRNTSTSVDANFYCTSTNGIIGTSSGSPFSFHTSNTERARINSTGAFMVGKTDNAFTTAGADMQADGEIRGTRNNAPCLSLNRLTGDGVLVQFFQDTTLEGDISVSGSTVSYNGGHLSRWSQLPDGIKDDSILKGTVLSNLDDMCVWEKDGVVAENEQLNKMKVSNVEGDTNVAGVFVNWTIDEQYGVDDMNVAMTGDMIIRIAQGVVVQKGDLLMSAGDGTAKPQSDDIVRSKTIAKVTSNYVTCTYADGSYCVPCVLMAC